MWYISAWMSFYHKIKKSDINSSNVYGLFIIPAPNDSLQNITSLGFIQFFEKLLWSYSFNSE